MPIVSMFYGIIIRMYFIDNKEHHAPHVHAEYGDDKAVININTGEVLAGKIHIPKLRLIQAWIEIHREELIADWNLAVNGEKIFKIKPLR